MVRLLGAMILAAALTGCGRGPARPAVFPAGGIVRYQGHPLSGAQVSFLVPGVPRLSTGITDEQGRFTLTTFEPGDGAVAGDQVVIVSLPRERAKSDSEQDYAAAMQALRKPVAQRRGPAAKYANPATSGLRETVTADGSNQFVVELRD
jgi:hypothetical protein